VTQFLTHLLGFARKRRNQPAPAAVRGPAKAPIREPALANGRRNR
jgi:hypothetical protein